MAYMNSTPNPNDKSEVVSPERMSEIANRMTASLDESLSQINGINRQARLLSVNARVEASRAGGKIGASFDVVAQAMGELSVQTDRVASELGTRSKQSIGELERMNRLLSTNFRGMRLSDLALTNIDLIDRNLYERSCDVRWWATDASVVDALTSQSPESFQFASRRLGIILDSYTVYYDLVLCDTKGMVVANGRPNQYRSLGSKHFDADWFRSAMRTRSGTEFGFQSVHQSSLVRQRSLVYSCAVRAGGEATGKPLGVLGIVFNWDALAQTVVEKVPLAPEEREQTRVCITDQSGMILADTAGRQLQEIIELPNRDSLFSEPKNFAMVEMHGQKVCIAHAQSPGFETYKTGWHSLLIYKFS
jgi:hypothetical protein